MFLFKVTEFKNILRMLKVNVVMRQHNVWCVCVHARVYQLPGRCIISNFILAVTGAVKPGSLVALMGGSGAGKSTLMAALAYRNPGKQSQCLELSHVQAFILDVQRLLLLAGAVVVGDIRVNGRALGVYMHRLSGFMHQEDLFVGSLTVREHLDFMVRAVQCW